VDKGGHVIASTIVCVGIGFARRVTCKLIQDTLKHTSNGASANTINISLGAFEVRAVILNDVRFSSARRTMNEQKPENKSKLLAE
jgi:hypothetical protein